MRPEGQECFYLLVTLMLKLLRSKIVICTVDLSVFINVALVANGCPIKLLNILYSQYGQRNSLPILNEN